MTRRTLAALIVSVGLAGAAVPLVAGPANGSTAAYSGFSTSAVATPLEVDVYEPTIPLPAEPQLEFEIGYSKAVADNGGSRSRASLLWPGASLGEGFKTIADAIGLPPDIGKQGYPLQSNATYPAGPASDSKDTAPGAVMRTAASADKASGQAGYSADCDVQDTPGTGNCPLPAALAAVADVAGSVATSGVEKRPATVRATSGAAAGQISLLSGLLTVSGVSARATSTSDGRRPLGVGEADYAAFSLAGQRVRLGPDGAALPGQTITIPGLPADPNAALAQLGVTITIPKPLYDRQGSLLTTTSSALVVQVDCAVLRHKLDVLPISTIGDTINQLPDQLGPIKSALGAALYLAPRFVFTLAKVQSAVNTAQGISIPPLPVNLGLPVPPFSAEPAAVPALGTGTGPLTVQPQTLAPQLQALPAGMQAAGFPKRFHMPGALLLAAIVVAALAGAPLRRISAVLFGLNGSCPHGLHDGLPDLRKVDQT